MTELDRAVEALPYALARHQDAALADVANIWRIVGAELAAGGPAEKAAVIAALREFLPDLVDAHASLVADATAAWYDELAPDQPYSATAPTGIVPAERVEQSIALDSIIKKISTASSRR